MAEAKRGRELEPVSLIVNVLEGSTLYFARRNEEAGVRLRKALELDANLWLAHFFLGNVLLQKKRYAAALTEFGKARDFSGGNSTAVSMIGYVHAISGEPAQARAILQELTARSAQGYVPPLALANVYMGLGETEGAFASLEKAYQDRDVFLSFLKVDPKWDPVRSDPRFVSILQRIGLE